jgi:molybdopterin molybdotransferase
MTPRPPLLSVDDALDQIIKAVSTMPSERIAVEAALGHVLAADINAKLSHPPADVSAMDGYAVHSSHLSSTPKSLTVIGESAAGHPFDGVLGSDQAVRIFTGAYVPQGADAIVLQEDTSRDGDVVTILEQPKPQQFIRKAGQDFSRGDLIASKGATLDARRLALIASSGHGTVPTHRKPVVAIISTGDELVRPGSSPKEGQIVSSNDLFLTHLVTSLGATAMNIGQVADQDDALTKAFDQAKSADLIVTSGGASVGNHDGVARHMNESGGLAFWRIAMRPGKPLIFGQIDQTPMLGLPGNPVSTGVCAMIFVAAAIRKMLGQDPLPKPSHAKLLAPLGENDRRQDYLRARIHIDDQGQTWAEAFNKQDSGMLKTFADADGLIIRPPHAPPAEAGDPVPVLLLPR